MDSSPEQPNAPQAAGPKSDAQRRLEAWLALPDGDGAELLAGQIVYRAMASLEHGDTIAGINAQLDGLRGPRGPGGGGWWFSNDPHLFLAGQGVRPDIAGWRVDKHPRPPGRVNVGGSQLGVCVTPPDWVCEVLSPSTSQRDDEQGIKWRTYFEAGIEHYWIGDTAREQLIVYRRGTTSFEPVEIAGRGSRKRLAPFESIEIDVGRLFLMAAAQNAGQPSK